LAESQQITVTLAEIQADYQNERFGVIPHIDEQYVVTDASATANSIATGIFGGSRLDTLTNEGTASIAATATAGNASILSTVAIHIDGQISSEGIDMTLATASQTATAQAIGIDGGDDDDAVTNNGRLAVTAGSTVYAAGADVLEASTFTVNGDNPHGLIADISSNAGS
jgi:hypothetical protein